jgi:outer membrane lipoprotein SlyB
MRLKARMAITLGVLALLAACQRDISPDSYAVGSVGQVNRTVRGVVISARPVNIGGSQSGLGIGVGAAGGGLAGSALGKGSGNGLAVLGGVIAGGIAGAIAEDAMTRQTGIEYVVQTENGALLTIVQGPQPAFSITQKVLVIYGNQARVVADPAG